MSIAPLHPVANLSLKGFTMRTTVIFGVWLLLSAAVHGGDWKLAWSDEFDKPGLPDASRWNYEEGFIRNNEAQYYTQARKENARVEDGMLIIEARKERWKNPSYEPGAQGRGANRKSREFAEFTSASLTTRGK